MLLRVILCASSVGLVTDGEAQVLDAQGAAIAGLYARGNQMNSIIRGSYLGPGITPEPSVVFACRVRDARAWQARSATIVPTSEAM